MAFFCLLFLFSRQNDTKVCKNWYVTTSHLRYSKATHLVHRFSLCYVYVAAESLKLFKRAEKIGYIFDVSQKFIPSWNDKYWEQMISIFNFMFSDVDRIIIYYRHNNSTPIFIVKWSKYTNALIIMANCFWSISFCMYWK